MYRCDLDLWSLTLKSNTCHRLVVRSMRPCWNVLRWGYGGHVLDLTPWVSTGVRREEGYKDYWRGGMGRDVKRPTPPPPPPTFQPLHLCTIVTFVYRKTPLWHKIRFEIIFYASLKLIGSDRPKVHALLHQYLICLEIPHLHLPYSSSPLITVWVGLLW